MKLSILAVGLPLTAAIAMCIYLVLKASISL
ncbi:hypothetical protein F116p68 [Pseudomonas phage F116]|uniref:Uncharacterized protein n=1 Tax=Pseudomonas phage F116 TaxID=2679904 RepID=Q5QF68_9CAUD|nr:hypothetical protein F116p68 [Pseudomonas phage F116]AAT47257.1 unknown [Pseudomonas phage F116]